MIILIIIIGIILLWYLTNRKQKKNTRAPTTVIIEQPINIIKRKRVITPYKYYYDDKPSFRGLVYKYHTIDKNEYGGSKPFNHIKMNNINMNNNKIKYHNYGSYRIKPTTRSDLH